MIENLGWITLLILTALASGFGGYLFGYQNGADDAINGEADV